MGRSSGMMVIDMTSSALVDISNSCPTFQELMSQSARCIAFDTVERTSIHQVRK